MEAQRAAGRVARRVAARDASCIRFASTSHPRPTARHRSPTLLESYRKWRRRQLELPRRLGTGGMNSHASPPYPSGLG